MEAITANVTVDALITAEAELVAKTYGRLYVLLTMPPLQLMINVWSEILALSKISKISKIRETSTFTNSNRVVP